MLLQTKIFFQVSDKYKKYLRPSNAIRDQLFKDTCDNLMERFHNINVEQTYKNTEHGPIIETPKKTTVDQKVSLSILLLQP